MLPPEKPLRISQTLLSLFNTEILVHHGDRIPTSGPVLFVSNHRSFMDALVMMVAAKRPIRFACHPYMSQVPILNQLTEQLGCLSLLKPQPGQHTFFQQAAQLLQQGQSVGIFPEGAAAMTAVGKPNQIRDFQRGFAHLALQATCTPLTIVPIAIASIQETIGPLFPVQLLSWFDPTEPLFRQRIWHPIVIYRQVRVYVGHPWQISEADHQKYRSRASRAITQQLAWSCQQQIQALLSCGCNYTIGNRISNGESPPENIKLPTPEFSCLI